jgi:hypothetical protein
MYWWRFAVVNYLSVVLGPEVENVGALERVSNQQGCAIFNLRRVYGNFFPAFVVGDHCRTQDFHRAKFLPGQDALGSRFPFHACENACLIP